MISELKEIRRGNTFSRQDMPHYCFIYLLYKDLVQKKEFTTDLPLLISSLDVADSIKNLLTKYLKELPDNFRPEDFHKFREDSLQRYFSSFKNVV